MKTKQKFFLMTTKSMLSAVAFCLVLSIPGLAYAAFNFTTIDVPGSTLTEANGNSTKQIVGDYDDVDGNKHGFILDKKGIFRKVDVPNAPLTLLNEVNEEGQIVGTYFDGTRLHGFFLNKGNITTLDPPGSIRSQGGGINEKGQVVGVYRTSDQKRHGYLWRNGVFTSFNVPNDHPVLGTVALGINDQGQIAGNYVDLNGDRHGFLLSKGIYTQLDFPGAAFTIAQGINNEGQIVGQYFNDDESGHGFLLSKKGGYTSIDIPDATFTAAFAINDKGEIVGSFDDVDGNTHGYVGIPKH
jgi:probable HAF family extracellular repeat protein